MKSSLSEKIRRSLTGLAVEIMPLVPLPEEWYRKILVKDSEKRYATGRWNYLRDVAESHRYSIIAGCCDYYQSGDRRILDIGCGEGILQKRIKYSEYVGVDMNAEAIELAKEREDSHTHFHFAPAESFLPEGVFDVIVFNESLYYIGNPMSVLAKYRAVLADQGVLIICMFQTNLARKIWKRIDSTDLIELTAVKISNEWGFSSVVKAYANCQLDRRLE